MIKHVMISLIAVMAISSCSSGPPTRNVIGLPINKVISSKYHPHLTLLTDGTKQYSIAHRVEPSPGVENCMPGIKASDPPSCTPGPGMDGSDTTTIYTVSEKGIITDVTQSWKNIPNTSPNYGWSTVKPEEPPLPEYTPEQDEAISDFYKRVHKR